jgi:hypothetical protein
MGFIGCGKTRQWACFVTGHDFSRADKAHKINGALAPAGKHHGLHNFRKFAKGIFLLL